MKYRAPAEQERKMVSIRMPADLLEQLKRTSSMTGIDVTMLIVDGSRLILRQPWLKEVAEKRREILGSLLPKHEPLVLNA